MATRYSGKVTVRLTVDDHGVYKGTVRAPGVTAWPFRLKLAPVHSNLASDSAKAYDLAAASAIAFAANDEETFMHAGQHDARGSFLVYRSAAAAQSHERISVNDDGSITSTSVAERKQGRKNPSESTSIDHAAYQKKVRGLSNAALLYTMKDAADAIKAHPTGHKAGYYADEINYCANEVRRRLEEAKGKGKKTFKVYVDQPGGKPLNAVWVGKASTADEAMVLARESSPWLAALPRGALTVLGK